VTYSIVARDASTGELGVAVQSHYFATGSMVTWAEPGVGAVATQAEARASYGALGLSLMGSGMTPAAALAGLTAADDGRRHRQVAMIDAGGEAAAHTGEQCIAEAGHRLGDGWSAQANMMRRDTVWDAMGDAFEASTGDLASRLLDALDAAEAQGGDLRGRQSAALLVVPATGPAWTRTFDVRVDDHPEPLVELRRLTDMRRAYLREEDSPAMGDNPELAFWQALGLATSDRVDDARPLIARAVVADVGWADLLRRLPAAGLFPDDPRLIERLLPL
jgi:uncharacterized Ntn-hydrolase superfamily protein